MKTLNQCLDASENKLSRGETDKLYTIQRMIVADAVSEFLKQAVEGTAFDSMEETVYVTAFVGKLEKLIRKA